MSRPLRSSIETILIAILLAIVVRTFLVTGYKVPTSTMVPTLLPGDFIFSFRPAGGFSIPFLNRKFGIPQPTRGELIVFTFPDQPRTPYVKRVVGIPGDKIQMQEGNLIVNDQPMSYTKLDADSLRDAFAYDQLELWQEKAPEGSRQIVRQQRAQRAQEDFGPLMVPPNEVFVLGDHRAASDDSRYWGTVPLERIEGRVLMIWLSLDSSRRWGNDRLPPLRTGRLFMPVH